MTDFSLIVKFLKKFTQIGNICWGLKYDKKRIQEEIWRQIQETMGL